MANNGQLVYQGLLQRGFDPVQAAALAGNIQQESDFNPTAVNPTSGAYGLMQWLGDRAAGLKNYAEQTGGSISDPNTQLDYLVHEMKGPESGNVSGFFSAKDVPDANAALKAYVRYGDNEAGKRLQYSLAFAGEHPNAAVEAARTEGQDSGMGFVNPGNSAPFLPGAGLAPGAVSGPSKPAAVAAPSQAQSDDELLGQFLPGKQAAPKSSAPETPLTDDQLLEQFLPAAPKAGAPAETATQPTAATTPYDPAQSPMRAQEAPSQAENVASDMAGAYKPSSLPLIDPLAAAANGFINAIPVVGPTLENASTAADVGLNNLLAPILGEKPQTFAERQAINRGMAKAYPTETAIGNVAGTVAPYLGLGMTGLGGKLLGTTGNIGSRMLAGGLSSAVIQGLDTLARGGSPYDATQNALVGGALGTVAAPVADLVGAGVNKLIGKTAPEVAKLAQMARDKYNIPIGPAQMSDNALVRHADTMVNKVPFSGGTVSHATQQSAFNRAVSRTFGENATALTPDVMANAKSRISNMFEDVASKVPAIPFDDQLQNDLVEIARQAPLSMPESDAKVVGKQLDDVLNTFTKGGDQITGKTYQAITARNSPLDRALNNTKDPNIRFAAQQIRTALDDALERSAPSDALAQLKQARSQWKAMRTVEDLTEKAPTGDISPALLMGAVRKSYGDMAYGGGGDLANLARIGQQFLKAAPSSGTAENLAVLHGLHKVGEFAGPAGMIGLALNPGAIPMAAAVGLPTAAGTIGAAKAAGALMRSEGLANRLIANSLGRGLPATGTNLLMRAGVPAVEGESAGPRLIPHIVIGGGPNNPLPRNALMGQ